jgi:hypothetical protein
MRLVLSRPPFTPEPKNGTVKVYSRIVLLVKTRRGSPSRIPLIRGNYATRHH